MKILITGAIKFSSLLEKKIKKMGYDVIFVQNESEYDYSLCEEIEGIICNNFFSFYDIKKFKNLFFIQLSSAGMDRVPLDYIKKNNILLYRAADVYNIPIAEWVILGVLSLYKKINYFIENKNKHVWIKNRNLVELYKKNICILGCGKIGKEIAKRFKAFGCYVYGIDLFEKKERYFNKVFSLNDIDEVIKEADVIILSLPLTETTKYIIDERKLNLMKSSSILINISRGNLIDEKALIEHLKKEPLKGAILDVFSEEPLSCDNELWELENVVLSPHNSFISEGNQTRLEKDILRNLANIIKIKRNLK